jgi:hypothetical protein
MLQKYRMERLKLDTHGKLLLTIIAAIRVFWEIRRLHWGN